MLLLSNKIYAMVLVTAWVTIANVDQEVFVIMQHRRALQVETYTEDDIMHTHTHQNVLLYNNYLCIYRWW